MVSYELRPEGFFYLGSHAGDAACVIDFGALYDNLSAYSCQITTGNERSLFSVMHRLITDYQEQAGTEEVSVFVALVVIKQALLAYRPLRILCGGTSLAFAAARAAVAMHPESRVYMLSGAVDDKTDLAKNGVTVYPLFGMPEGDALRDGFFDVTVLEEEDLPGDPVGFIRRMHRVTRVGGDCVCAASAGGALEPVFRAASDVAPDLYTGDDPSRRVLVRRVAEDSVQPDDTQEEARRLLRRAEAVLGETDAVPPPLLRLVVSLLRKAALAAARQVDLSNPDLKQSVSEATENALNCLYTEDAAFRNVSMARLRRILSHKPCGLRTTQE